MSLNKAKAVAQRKILAAAQSREANMALVLVCTVLMFIICHAPRLFTSRYVFISFYGGLVYNILEIKTFGLDSRTRDVVR